MTFRCRRLVRGPLAAIAFACVAASFAGCSRAGEVPADFGAIAVTTQAARVTTLRDVVTAAGTIIPMAAADFVVAAAEPCAIAELPKAEGDAVQAGDIVVRLDIPAIASDVAMRQLELTDATARAELAKAEADRFASLFEKGLAARTQLETARSAASVAESNLSQARGRLDAAKAAEATTIIRARFAGVVVKRWHGPGDRVTGLDTDPILRIVDPARLQVTMQLPTADANRILPGQVATVQTETGGEAAVVSMKLTPTSPAVTTTDVRLNFLVPTLLPLDTPVQVDIVVNERPDAITIPADAVQRANGVTFVWVPNENSQATRREVRLGLITNNQAQIVSGLAAGEPVIVTGLSQLTDGVSITISKG